MTLKTTSPKVELIACTEWDEDDAIALLLYTKRTRLEMAKTRPEDVATWVRLHPEEALEEIDYMASTIRSSWEFLDYTFLISGVSRACAQQITRSRVASFAMQSQRVSDISGASCVLESNNPGYVSATEQAMDNYSRLVDAGTPLEVARGVLPMNVSTAIVAKYNLRTLVDLIIARTSPRAQGEFRSVAEQMRDTITRVHPFTKRMIRPRDQIAFGILEDALAALSSGDPEDLALARTLVAKARDQLNG